MSLIHKYKNKKALIRWIKYHVKKEELEGFEEEEEINQYIYDKLKNYDFSNEGVRIVPCKSWLKHCKLYDIADLLGFFDGIDHFQEAGFHDYKIFEINEDEGIRLSSPKILSEIEELDLINNLKGLLK